MNPSSNDFSFLKGKINVLTIDNHIKDQQAILDELCKIDLFSVTSVSTEAEAVDLIQKGCVFHFCLLEFSNFYLQRKYSNKIDFIYITEKQCIETGFQLFKLGAKGVYSKPLQKDKVDEIKSIMRECFLNRLLNPFDENVVDSQVHFWCEILKSGKINSVTEWAVEAGVDESYLRRKIKLWFKISPKILINVYRIYSLAFQNYFEIKIEANGLKLLEKLKKFYLNNINDLQKILTYN